MADDPANYPVNIDVDLDTGTRNRLTVGFRAILAIPHLFLSGFIGSTGGGFSNLGRGTDVMDFIFTLSYAGVLGLAAFFCAVFSWFAILFTGTHPRTLWDFQAYVLRWQVRTSAYVALFRDEYPPFGEGEYPAAILIEYPEGPRDKVTVAFRIILAIPHLIVVAILGVAWFITTVIAWFALLFTGAYPPSLAEFGKGVFRWSARVAAYTFLMRDEYPPFSLNA